MIAIALAAAVILAVGALDGGPGRSRPAASPRSPSPERLVGQRVMVGVAGSAPDAELLARVRSGRVGAVILYSFNLGSRARVRSLTDLLQHTARAGGNPPLLVAIDQEGGEVKRFADAPPRLSPPQMVATGDPRVAYREGLATGRYLRRLGINMDLAPVVDVPTVPGAFIRTEGRAFSPNPRLVAFYGDEFARGLQAAGVAATAKHFPGVGSATLDTDKGLDVLRPSALQRRAALEPYRSLIGKGPVDAIMITTAGFPAYEPSGVSSVLSRRIATGLLRKNLRFAGVSVTEALRTPTGLSEDAAGVLAARAGIDLLLYANSGPGGFDSLFQAARRGQLNRANLLRSYQRIVALKRRLGRLAR